MPFEKFSKETSIKPEEKEMVKQMPKPEDYKKDNGDEDGKTKVKVDAPPPFEKEAAKIMPEKFDSTKSTIESARKVNLAE